MKIDEARPDLRAWLVVALLWFVAGFNYLDRVMVATMHRSLVTAIPMTDAQFGLLTSGFLWVYGLLGPVGGYLADRFSRSKMILVSMFAWSATTWLTAHATTFNELLATRALMGISEAAYLPAALALIADYHRGPTRSLATGVHMTGILAGSALGGLGGLLAEGYGWRHPFSLFGMIGVAYCGVLVFTLRDAPREEQGPPTGVEARARPRFGAAIASLFARGSFVVLFIFWGVLAIVGWSVTGWMPTYLMEHFHLAQGRAGLTATVSSSAASFLGVLVGGAWADRWSRTQPRARILVPAIGLCLAIPGILLASNTSVLVFAILGLVLYGLTRAFTDSNLMPILCVISNPRYRATGYGVLNMIANIIGGLSIYAGGMLRDRHIDVTRVFEFGAGGMAVSAALLMFVNRQARLIRGGAGCP